jgi:glyoxalase family protein
VHSSATRVNGLHHITAISGPPQENIDFYTGILGMRLVKKSVNQDDPGTYHLFYADAEGHPGADLTFFPWVHMAPSRMGHGLVVETSLEIPAASLDYWSARLEGYGVALGSVENRFGDRVLPLIDPHGMRVALVEPAAPRPRLFTPWDDSAVPLDRQIRGLYSARLWEREAAPTTTFLTGVMGFEHLGTQDGWMRYGFPDAAGGVDVRETPSERRGAWGVGCVHHLAWRVDDDAHEAAMRATVEAAGARPTPVIDRFWFKSVYFKEPGGVLFELATDGPGFAIDEDPHHLGESLILPPWLEPNRAVIEAALDPVKLPTAHPVR